MEVGISWWEMPYDILYCTHRLFKVEEKAALRGSLFRLQRESRGGANRRIAV